uniref:Uncharacterized protein n=1 Tax=Sphenodon punctatus TaxID=8508 RepID=A0A8D0HEC6_SPHPU
TRRPELGRPLPPPPLRPTGSCAAAAAAAAPPAAVAAGTQPGLAYNPRAPAARDRPRSAAVNFSSSLSLDSLPGGSRDMSSAPTTPPSVDKVDGFSRKSVRKARQKRSQSSSQFRSQGKPIELTPLPLLKGKTLDQFYNKNLFFVWNL